MSDHHLPSDHDDHSAPAPSLIKKGSMIAVLAGVPLVTVMSLVSHYTSHENGTGASDMTEEAVTARIQKVGLVSLGQSKRELKTGEDVYKVQCGTCHAAGMLGAPKFADAGAWSPRVKTGFEALLNSALKGKNAMTPQGGGAFSDYEIGRAVVYMANAGGAKFDEPKAPAGTAAPDAAASAAK
jgi:cytochrome c5